MHLLWKLESPQVASIQNARALLVSMAGSRFSQEAVKLFYMIFTSQKVIHAGFLDAS